MPPYPKPPMERFMAKVQKTETCWLWTGARHPATGYCTFGVSRNERSVVAHRWVYQQLVGPIPEGLQVDHICRVRQCMNPSHLRLVTPGQNQQNRGVRKDSKTGIRGVVETKHGTFATHVCHQYRKYTAGIYKTLEEAETAVVALRLELFTHNDGDRP